MPDAGNSRAPHLTDRWATRGARAWSIVQHEGPLALVSLVRKRGGLDYVRRQARYMLCSRLAKPWDAMHNVDTAGQIDLKDIEVVGPHREHGHAAVSISPRTFRNLSRFFPEDRGSYTYIDMGAGKGRTVLLASTMSFRQAIGVEFAGALCEVAARNVRSFRHPRANPAICSIVHADVSQYELPDDNLVLWFNNPFGAALWRLVLANIARSYADHPRKMMIVYGGSEPVVLQRIAPLIPATGIFQGVGRGVAPFYLDTYLPYHYEVFETI
jgi:hypothetical protein